MKRKQLVIAITIIIILIIAVFAGLIIRSFRDKTESIPESVEVTESENMVDDTAFSESESEIPSTFSESSLQTEETVLEDETSGEETYIDENDDDSPLVDDYVIELEEDESFEIN